LCDGPQRNNQVPTRELDFSGRYRQHRNWPAIEAQRGNPC
jgi:hypothetical protein